MSRPELLAALLLCASGAWAHGLDQREAVVVVGTDRVVTAMEVDAGAEQAALEELVVRDEDGECRVGRIVSASPAGTPDHVLLRLEYPLARPPRWLSFQLAPEEVSASRARRLLLSVTSEEGAQRRQVNLTSGGNVETLRFGAPEPAAACGPALLDRHPERLRSAQALLRRDARGARLDIVLPLGLVESWLPLPRAERDGIGVAEQEAASPAVLELVAARVRWISDGRPVPPADGEVVFLGLDDAAIDAAPLRRRLDAWTARVRVSLRFDRAGELRWDLWNARVTTASVVILDGMSCAERRLSTYDPKL